MFKLMDKKIIAILHSKIFLNWPYEHVKTNMSEQADKGLFVCFFSVIIY